jgi:hypothetical protein
MFLPVLLVNSYGLAGWIAFAIPNVLGAAAMGWVIKTQEQSRQMVRTHRAACTAFSLVTILFHLYFIAWILTLLTGPLIAILTVPLAVGLWLLFRNDRRSIRVAILVYVLSLLAFLITIAFVGVPTWNLAQGYAPFSQHGVVWLFPVCFLGFLTCPYLDLTFHRARQFTSRDGAKVAFGVGFGVFFLLMILFTLWYAGRIYQSVFSDGERDFVIWLVAGHMIVQSAFTIAAHARAVYPAESTSIPIAFLIGCTALALTFTIALALRSYPGFGTNGYLLFMSFYGLVAPAYVCSAMGVIKWRPIWFVAAIVIAAPMYWLGFINNWTIWLLPGVVVVLIASLISRYSGSSAASANSESLPARQESML